MKKSDIEVLSETYKNLEINKENCFIIDGDMCGSVDFIAKFFKTTSRNVYNWIKRGLEPTYIIDHKKAKPIFSILKSVEWFNENIDKKKSKTKVFSEKETEKDYSNTDIENISKDEADRLLQIEKVKIERAKYDEMSGKLIDAEDTDKALAELAALHIMQYKNSKKIFPSILEMKESDEISYILDKHFEKSIEELSVIVNRVTDSDGKTLSDTFLRF